MHPLILPLALLSASSVSAGLTEQRKKEIAAEVPASGKVKVSVSCENPKPLEEDEEKDRRRVAALKAQQDALIRRALGRDPTSADQIEHNEGIWPGFDIVVDRKALDRFVADPDTAHLRILKK